MTALYIIAAIVGVFALLLWCRIGVTFTYDFTHDGTDSTVTVRYAFFRIRIVPKKKKKLKLSDYTYKKTHKKKKHEKKSEKSGKKAGGKNKKKKAGESTSQGEESESEKPGTLKMLIDLREAIIDVLKRTPGKLRLVIYRLGIIVGAEDASSTATMYGAVTQGVGAFLALAQEKADVRVKKHAVLIVPDFHLGEIEAYVKASLSVRTGAVLMLALRFIVNFFKIKISQNREQ